MVMADLQNRLFFDLSRYFGDEIIAAVSQVNPDRIFRDKLLERYSYAGELGFYPEQLAFPVQVHSNRVIQVSTAGSVNSADGLITRNPDIVLSIVTADCLPLFIWDELRQTRALVHAGWRGVTGKIVTETLNQLKLMDVTPETLTVVAGPSVHMKNYEVNSDVADLFSPGNKVQTDQGKWHVNLFGAVRDELISFGGQEENILDSGICSVEDKRCHSYRRDGLKAGRMYSYFGRKNESA